MREKAMEYYRQGYGCSRSVLMAFEQAYPRAVAQQVYRACAGLDTGLGVGCLCGALIAGVMIFGILFDTGAAKRLRMSLFDQMAERGLGLYCARLREKAGEAGCAELVGEIASVIDKIIREELSSFNQSLQSAPSGL